MTLKEALASALGAVLFCPVFLPFHLLVLLEGRAIDLRSLPALEFDSNPVAYVILALFTAAVVICGSLYSIAFMRAVVRRLHGKPGGLSIRRTHF